MQYAMRRRGNSGRGNLQRRRSAAGKLAAERAERDRKEHAEFEAREKQKQEQKEREEKERLEKEERYQAFLKEYGYEEVKSRDFVITKDYLIGEVRLYKLAGVFKIK